MRFVDGEETRSKGEPKPSGMTEVGVYREQATGPEVGLGVGVGVGLGEGDPVSWI